MALDLMQAVFPKKKSIEPAPISPKQKLSTMMGRVSSSMADAMAQVGRRRSRDGHDEARRRMSAAQRRRAQGDAAQPEQRQTRPKARAGRPAVPRAVASAVANIARTRPQIIRAVSAAARPEAPDHQNAVEQIRRVESDARQNPAAARTLAQMRLVNRTRQAIGSAERRRLTVQAAQAKRGVADHVMSLPPAEREATRDTAARAIERIDAVEAQAAARIMRPADVPAIASPERAFSVRMYDEDYVAANDESYDDGYDESYDDGYDEEEWYDEEEQYVDDDARDLQRFAGVVNVNVPFRPLGSAGATIRRLYRAGQIG